MNSECVRNDEKGGKVMKREGVVAKCEIADAMSHAICSEVNALQEIVRTLCGSLIRTSAGAIRVARRRI